MIWGRAYIGGAKYPKVVRRNKAPFKALLCDSFGSIDKLTDKLGADSHTQHIQWYGIWKDNHDFKKSDIPKMVANAKKLQSLAVKYPSKFFYYCPMLEDKQNESFKLDVMQKCKAVAPNVQLVNNPLKGGAYLKGFINEIHHDDHNGIPEGVFFFSVDGRAGGEYKNGSVDMPHQKYVEKYKNAFVFMEWILQDNGKRNTKDETKRPFRKAWVTPDLDDSVSYLMKEISGTSVKKGDLYGSHSEQYTDGGGGTQNKPFYITESKRYKKLELKTLNNVTLETITHSEKYNHGSGYLYRFKDWGFKLGEKAKKLSGSSLCNIFADGKKIATIDPGFREPGR